MRSSEVEKRLRLLPFDKLRAGVAEPVLSESEVLLAMTGRKRKVGEAEDDSRCIK